MEFDNVMMQARMSDTERVTTVFQLLEEGSA